jgi:hypothetical protein
MDLLCLRIAQVPRSPGLAIFVLTTDKSITLPLAHVRKVINKALGNADCIWTATNWNPHACTYPDISMSQYLNRGHTEGCLIGCPNKVNINSINFLTLCKLPQIRIL